MTTPTGVSEKQQQRQHPKIKLHQLSQQHLLLNSQKKIQSQQQQQQQQDSEQELPVMTVKN